ncbi:MAG: hypothetical protein JSU81_10595 [Candidatus Coatesbacteria bacterium]|nr:MAG: hypothetical protein JSU81_10595 [Candidatus Coatesbacteria bacterium]
MKKILTSPKMPLVIVLLLAAAAPLTWVVTVAVDEGLNLPSDDAWIHQVFARNLAREGRYEYNVGERSCGVTAPLWTLLLSETYFFRLPPRVTAVALTVLSHILWAGALYWLGRAIWPDRSRWWAAAPACLLSLLGPVMWFAVSGMETALFFGLATLAAAAWARDRPTLAGFAAAATFPVRPEGALLIVFVFGWWVYRLAREKRRPTAAEVVGYVAFPLMFGLPFVIHNWIVTGVPFPTTYFGRHWLYLGSVSPEIRVMWKDVPAVAFYWFRYIQVWMLGQHDLSNTMKILTDSAVLYQIGLWAAAIQLLRRRLPRAFAFFFIWVLAHNLFYALVLPNFGTAGRYQGCNFALFALASVYGALFLLEWIKGKWLRIIPYVFLVASFIAALGSYLVWRNMYSDNIHHITTVHEAAGKWVNENLAEEARVAAFDIGIFGYYADRYIVDLGGLLDRESYTYLRERTMSQYLKKKNAHYLAMMDADTHDIRPLPDRLGLYQDEGTVFRLEFLKSWTLNISRRRWINVTAVAYPRLNLYRIEFMPD